MPIELNELETQRFGITAAKVTDASAPLDRINARAAALGVDMLSIRLPVEDLAHIHALEADGFRLMDTLVYYRIPLAPPGPGPDPQEAGPIRLRRAVPEDCDGVGAVAEVSFEGYIGHYHTDPKLSNDAADAAYVDWARRSIAACVPMSPVVVAEDDEGIVGFMSNRILEGDVGEIVLSAVHTRGQGHGLYGRLVDWALADMQQQGCVEGIVSTQLNNVAVQRAWAKRGLRLANSYYTLHKWYDRAA